MRARLAALFLLIGLASAPAFAQGCAMCYTSAKGAADGGQRAITRAVITLLIPPVSMMAVLVGIAFRYNRGGHKQEMLEEPEFAHLDENEGA